MDDPRRRAPSYPWTTEMVSATMTGRSLPSTGVMWPARHDHGTGLDQRFQEVVSETGRRRLGPYLTAG